MRKLYYGAAALVVFLVAAALVVPSLIDWNDYKPEIADRVAAATGRALIIDGDIGLSVLPAPTLSVDGIRLANIEGATGPAMAAARSLHVRLAFWPLLSGRVEVESMRLEAPVIELEILADGRRNWDFVPASGPAAADPKTSANEAPSPDANTSAKKASGFKLGRLAVAEGVVIFRDRGAGTLERVEALDAVFSAGSLSGPFSVEGSARARNLALAFDVALGALPPGEAAPLSLSLMVGADSAKPAEIRFDGTVTLGEGDSGFAASRAAGKIAVKGDDLAALIGRLTGEGAGPAILARRFSLGGRVKADAAAIALDDAVVELDDTRGSGAVNIALGARPRADIALAFNRIDLDRWLASARKSAPLPPRTRKAKDGGVAKPPSPGSPEKADSTAASGFALPGGIDANIDMRAETVIYRGGIVRQLRLAAELDKGHFTLHQAAALLPGGADISFFGLLSESGGRPKFQGNLELVSDDLRAMLAWLDVDVAGIAPDRLRKLSATGRFDFAADKVSLRGLDVRFDSSKLTGAADIALRQRPAIGISLSLDRLNLDAYLGADPGGAATKRPPAPKSAADGGSGKAPDGAPAAVPALAFLGMFDANLRARIERLTVAKMKLSGLALDAKLQRGVLTLGRAGVDDIAGARMALSGTARGLGAAPAFDLEFDIGAKNATRLFRLAGIVPPVPPARLGRIALRGGFAGSMRKQNIDATFTAAGGRIKLAGAMDAMAPAPRYDLEFDLSHPSFAAFARLFDPGYSPAAGNLGGFALAGRLAGKDEGIGVTGLEGKIGPVAVAGSATVDLGGKRPRIVAALETGGVIVDLFLPRARQSAKSAPAPNGRAAARRTARTAEANSEPRDGWSKDPFDFTPLREIDGAVTLAAASIAYGRFQVDRPRLEANLGEGVLTLRRLDGRMFGGGFAMSGKLDAEGAPKRPAKLDGALSIDGADLRQALFATTAVDVASGKLVLKLDAASAGESPHAVISALSGGGRISVRDGAITGFDLPALSERLKQIDNPASLLGLLQIAMAEGSTPFTALTGSFAINKGVLKTNDLRLDAKAAAGAATGSFDLGARRMDLRAELRLTEHPKAPPFGMRLDGPFENPRRIFDINKIQAYLQARVVGSLLRKVLPKQSESSQSEAQESPAESPKPADILRGILKSLPIPGK